MAKHLNIKRYQKILNNIILKQFTIEIKNHAFIKAIQRNIDPDVIEAIIYCGKIKKFGKNYIKFIKKYKKFDVICVAQIQGQTIKILTIEKR